MNRKISNNLVTVTEAGLVIVVLIILYLVMSHYPTGFIFAASFCITLTLYIYDAYRSNLRVKNAVRRLTDEISALPNDLSEKSYDHIQDETRIFYEELTRTKKLLDRRSRNRQDLLDIVNTVAQNMEFGKLLRDLLPRLNEATRSSCSAFYTVNSSTNKLEIRHSVGFSKNIYGEFDLALGEGMIGQAALFKEVTMYRDIPEDTIYFVRTFLGKIKPRSLLVVPVLSQDQLTGVLVCASIYEYTREDREMIELIKYYLGVAVNNGENYERTKRLTSELTFQNKLIQDQHEEMKKRLNDKTQLLNTLINHVGDGCLFVLDVKGTVLVWNRGAEQMHGINTRNALGKSIDHVYEEAKWPPLSGQLQATVKSGAHTECFWRPDAEGENHRYDMSMTCMRGEQNEIIGILCLIKEI